jgi:hypothetical protein
MKAIEINGEIKTFSKYPKNFKHGDNLYLILNDKIAKELGFKDVVEPTFDSRIEKLDNLHLNGDVYTYDVIEKEITETLTELKNIKLQEINNIASERLSNTDWYIIRNLDSGEEVPSEVKTSRDEYRKRSNEIIDEINALTTKKDVITFAINL